jgi:hypothetical protein
LQKVYAIDVHLNINLVNYVKNGMVQKFVPTAMSQIEPLTATADPEAIYRPRPNNDHEEGEGFVVVVQSNIFRPDYLNTSTLPTNFTVSEMTANVGEVTIVT